MSIPILWRIILGYSIILLLAVGVAAYSIVQLGGLSGTARAALDTDNRMIAYQETLTDAFLSEVRYAGRFIINHNQAIHDEFRQFREDFKRYMNEMTTLAVSADIKARLFRVDESHLRYHDLFDQEVRYIKTGQPYAQSRYQQEREKTLDSALRELEGLKAQLHKNLHDKLEAMERAASGARTISIAGTLVLIGLGIGLSLAISKSITRPLAQLTRTVGQEAEPVLDAASDLSRIPEIRQLSDSLLQEKRKLRTVERSQAKFIDTVAEQVAAPLISVKQRLDQLLRNMAHTVPHDQNTSLDIIIKETDRLIEHCSRLQKSPTATLQSAINVHATAATRSSSSASPSVGNVVETASQYASIKTSSWNAGLHWSNDGLKQIVQRCRSLLAWPWPAVSRSINTLRDGKVKKQ